MTAKAHPAAEPDVTICIPAYQAEQFLDTTIRCAQGQTYKNVRIVISVDLSTDNTVEVANDFARRDDRIMVLEHDRRLGWCGNVNALLGSVQTEFFFLYFHDDFILPQYCERLREALVSEPTAASAHSDMMVIGTQNGRKKARSYEGPVAQRLMRLCTDKSRGITYRSMIRRSAFGDTFRMSDDDFENSARGEDFLIHMMGCGPAVGLPETLYVRWIREGGLVDGWTKQPLDQFMKTLKRELGRYFLSIDALVPHFEDNQAIKYALILHLMSKLKGRFDSAGQRLPYPSELHPDAPNLDYVVDPERFGSSVAHRLNTRMTNLYIQSPLS